MELADALRAGTGLVRGALDYARDVLARARAPLDDLVTWFTGRPAAAPDTLPGALHPIPDLPLQEPVAETKFRLGRRDTPPAAHPPVDREAGDLPRSYGTDRVVLLARDPWWLFAWWEITPETRVEALRRLGAEAEGARFVLRVHLLDGPHAVRTFDVDLPAGAEHWHVETGRPATPVRVEIGLGTVGGAFVPLVVSGIVTTPPAGPSGDTAVRWTRIGGEGPSAPTPASEPNARSQQAVPPALPERPPAYPSGSRSSDVHTPLRSR